MIFAVLVKVNIEFELQNTNYFRTYIIIYDAGNHLLKSTYAVFFSIAPSLMINMRLVFSKNSAL